MLKFEDREVYYSGMGGVDSRSIKSIVQGELEVTGHVLHVGTATTHHAEAMKKKGEEGGMEEGKIGIWRMWWKGL
ncbi:hypothetical protein SESBI_06496 [Sesbania bispinosa]|nr:hypothetical protein SESBI_06496 [Sesbania bispinosa]